MLSMTGYGRANLLEDGRMITVELRSVNHRFLDISFHMPRSFSFMEDAVRKQIASRLSRGHVDVTVTYLNHRSDAKTVRADLDLAKQYKSAIRNVNEEVGLQSDTGLESIVSLPDVLTLEEADDDEKALCSLMSNALSGALDMLVGMREKEGGVLKESLLSILDEIENSSFLVDERYPQTVKDYEKRLTDRVKELVGSSVDMARIAQEVAIMADKAAVNEETVRLRSHIKQARALCDKSEPVGRNLDFLIQEMNREVNTISSKSQDIPITNAVLKCKSEIEKLREQLQNIE